jgi:uncharacterized RDD family membrane protein YckC
MAGVAFKYAGFWTRFVAFIIDGLILGVIGGVLLVAVGDAAVRSLVDFLIGVVYFVGFWTLEGATPGKMAVGHRILTKDGGDLGLGRALLRYLGLYVSALVLLIGFIMIAFNKEKRGLHDYIAGTIVVQR